MIQIYGDLQQEVTSVAYDSRYVKKGGMFVAMSGFHQDGNTYIHEAVKKGARAIVTEKEIDKEIDDTAWIMVEDCRHSLAVISDAFYGHPSGKVNIVGITGTNGKTTTGYLAEAILSKGGSGTGVIGTITYRFAGREVPAAQTTPEALDLQRLLHEMYVKKVECCILEVSSHALALERVRGCEFDIGVFTNLSHDHLDFHRTEEDYFQAKLKLFTEYPLTTAVINMDDIYGERIYRLCGSDRLTYGIKNSADVSAQNVRMTIDGLSFTAKTPSGDIPVRSKLIGIHNVYNILAAMCVGISKDCSADVIKAGIESVKKVPGRFEPVDEGQDFLVAVDYAHTDDALKQVLSMAGELTGTKVITVFGCGGDRDKAKRPLMGKAAAQYSDYIIITSDNPRGEDPRSIIAEIKKGMDEILHDQLKYTIIEDRKAAIEYAVNYASKGDVVVIAGKGHEDYQIIGDTIIHFDDRETAREALKTRCLL